MQMMSGKEQLLRTDVLDKGRGGGVPGDLVPSTTSLPVQAELRRQPDVAVLNKNGCRRKPSESTGEQRAMRAARPVLGFHHQPTTCTWSTDGGGTVCNIHTHTHTDEVS